MIAVRMRGVTQRFGKVTALENVDLDVEEGTIHAIVGENGAGKTTLMRILYGAQTPTSGELEVEGQAVRFASSNQAIAAGIGMVSQHYGIIPELTCLQNLILGAEGGAVIDRRAAADRAEALAKRMGFQFVWHQEAARLSPSGAQKLEILKLLWRNAKIMILDEPTAMLSPSDGRALFESMQQLTGEGSTVLLVTHRLTEVMDYCRRVTVLRAGIRVAERQVFETGTEELSRLIVGGELEPPVTPVQKPQGETLLDVRGLTATGSRGEQALKDLAFKVHRGEIVGVAGVDGSGQRELFQTLIGVLRPAGGEVKWLAENFLALSTTERIRRGVRVIPEDRHAEAVVEAWSLEQNSALGLQRMAPLARGELIDAKARRKWAEDVAKRFATRHGGLRLPMASLSGGNQQRFVAARALEMSPELILAFQPARGLDLKGTAEVYRAVRARCDAGAAALVVGFDLDELIDHCDRIVVMYAGTLTELPPDKAKDREAIGRLMVGAKA